MFHPNKQRDIPKNLANKLQKMVGFRNIAVHDYQELSLDIFKDIVQHRLNDLDQFRKWCLEFAECQK